METVLSVISALEGTTITKEQLEATRLAKYINHLRRRTKCESLARRAKSLLKRWREMVGMIQSNESIVTSGLITAPAAIASNSNATTTTPFNVPVSDNAVCTSHLTNPQFSHQYYQRQQQNQNNVKYQAQHQQSYHSQPSSPVNIQEKSNPNEYLISISNPATSSQIRKSSDTNVRKKRKIEKNLSNENVTYHDHQQPTSFANLITGLSSTFCPSRKTTRDKSELVKPVETFVIEHSSNSNSDLICIPSNNTISSNFTSATEVPPVVIDLEDTNSSMNSLVSKDVTNTSSFYRNKISTKKLKKEKKRKDRGKNVVPRPNQPLQDCDDQNAATATYKRHPDILLLDDKSHSVCPTISNISEILSLSNSSMSSVFPSADAMSKNLFQSTQNELDSSSAQMSKSDLTFAGKFKQNTSSASIGCVLNYNSDSMNINVLNNNSTNKSKFSLFGGIEATNSNDSSSSSRTMSFHDVVNITNKEASNSRHNNKNLVVRHEINEKSISNMSHKGNSSTENTFAADGSTVVGVQQQQSIDLISLNLSSQQAIKQPKKRGRKKGSKGVDSVIAKETSLSSQMLISTIGVTGKKVKTTKELYAEMENRKLRNINTPGLVEIAGISSVSCVGQPQQEETVFSRHASVCSDIGDSESCSMTSEPSLDSGNILNKLSLGKRETLLDNSSNYSKHDSEFKSGDVKTDEEGSRHLIDDNADTDMTSKIKLELQDILKLLTPPPSIQQIEYESFKNITSCTCTIEKINAYADIESNESKLSNLNALNTTPTNNNNATDKDKLNIKQKAIVSEKRMAQLNSKDSMPPQSPPPAKVKKSIFDLDFDDDEDPLNSIIADVVGKNVRVEKELIKSYPIIEDKSELSLNNEDDLSKVYHQNTVYALNVPTPTPTADDTVFPSYEVKIDQNCKAKNRFEVQTQKITKFHVDTLHNCFIPNVNGNWNHANADSTRNYYNFDDDCRKNDAIIDGYNVVPFYGSDFHEQIVKDLSHIKFTNQFKVKHSICQNQNEILFHIPFLGVSRIPDDAGSNLCSIHVDKVTLDDEKENLDNKLNLNNILINTSALDTTDAKERENKQEIEMMSLKYSTMISSSNSVKFNNKTPTISVLKRTKKHATLVKRSTIKRLKLTSKENLEANKLVSDDALKLHRSLFFLEELYPTIQTGSRLHKECIFHISSCSSGCSSTDEEESSIYVKSPLNCRKRTISKSSSSSSSLSSSSEYNMLKLQQEIIQTEIAKRTALTIEKKRKKSASEEMLDNDKNVNINCNNENEDDNNNDDNDDENYNNGNDLPGENNRMLLSFNNIYNKSMQNKDRENNMLKQQLQNCDDYNNLNNNFNLIKYIDNKKTSSLNNINNTTNSCSNNLSNTTNINVTSSSYSHENLYNSTNEHQHINNENDIKITPFKEYQTGIRAVDEDVKDDDGNNCGRLQQFKEWHEVLQLRSYNNELLTVLPYVLLE